GDSSESKQTSKLKYNFIECGYAKNPIDQSYVTGIKMWSSNASTTKSCEYIHPTHSGKILRKREYKSIY
ncbi:hypothetical protein KSS87_008290, partial [Heliosperma pusillum]